MTPMVSQSYQNDRTNMSQRNMDSDIQIYEHDRPDWEEGWSSYPNIPLPNKWHPSASHFRDDIHEMSSMSSKRTRYHEPESGPLPSSTPPYYPSVYNDSFSGYREACQEQQPQPSPLSASNIDISRLNMASTTLKMAPPPRPRISDPMNCWKPPSQQYCLSKPRSSQAGNSNKSLLPPLQISQTESATLGPDAPLISNIDDLQPNPPATIEELFKCMPLTYKLYVLRQICPPLPFNTRKRGAIIAIEGTNQKLLEQIGKIVDRTLLESGECDVKIWQDDSESTVFTGSKSDPTISRTLGASSPSLQIAETPIPYPITEPENPKICARTTVMLENFDQFLRKIWGWRRKNRDIIGFVLNDDTETAEIEKHGAEPLSPQSTDHAISTIKVGARFSPPDIGKVDLKSSSMSSLDMNSSQLSASNTLSSITLRTRGSSKNRMSGSITSEKIPVALLTGGFSLTISDYFAARTPIADSYGPMDHWHWMMTMWRGIVGPDLTVYLQYVKDNYQSDAKIVEVINSRIIVVCVVEGSNDLHECMERRLGFEILEWVRTTRQKEKN